MIFLYYDSTHSLHVTLSLHYALPIFNHDEVEPYHVDKGTHHVEGRVLGRTAGCRQLGGTLTTLPPGAISFPFHYRSEEHTSELQSPDHIVCLLLLGK